MKSTTMCAAVALAVGLAVGGAPGLASASTLNSFTVSEGALNNSATNPTGIDTSPANTVNADTIDFGYNTAITLTNATQFSEAGNLVFATYRVGGEGGDVQSSYLDQDCSSLGGCSTAGYQMFANFKANGTYTNNGSVVSFTVTSFSYQLYVAPNTNTDDVGCTTNCSTAGATEIASGTIDPNAPGPSNGQIPLNTTNESQNTWGVYSTVDLTSLGAQFFSAPVPFYLDFNAGGQNDVGTLTGNVLTDNGTGDLDFLVPEPASLMLFGSGLLGLGFGAWRRKSRKTA